MFTPVISESSRVFPIIWQQSRLSTKIEQVAINTVQATAWELRVNTA
ncbi:hypothetical protein SAMN04515668_4879 [Hymenobacter arizonensis]|uniref:Uncharacterized protein n=1 Tax=Hymenobacter arizonensis TaxID=1227077 RepID=A0A1I6BPE2_HYMAR|nr:hypothetical protein SAMN04515668_4879 [Hymenobacter arizonensis]